MDCLFCFRGFIKVQIVDDEEYEKNEVFYIELFEPELYRPNGELNFQNQLAATSADSRANRRAGMPILRFLA